MNLYRPEGFDRNKKITYTIDKLKSALSTGEILEGKAIKSNNKLDLIIDLGNNLEGVIPYSEFEESVNGVTKSIAVISKVGHIVTFKVTEISEDSEGCIIKLSRKKAQIECNEQFINKLVPGDIIDAIITHIENYGLFCDIGCGNTALLPINNLCISRVNIPKKEIKYVKRLKVVVKSIDSSGKITLTHKELLGTWEEEASKFEIGDTVIGTVKSIKDYGIFVEMTPNLTGLAEYVDGVSIGDKVSVYVKGFTPEKMKVKLVIVNVESHDKINNRPFYYYRKTEGRIEEWVYSPEVSDIQIFTKFE